MISRTDPHFWKCYNSLPEEIRRLAKENFHLWERNCFHPSLHFKPIKNELWSVRISQSYRALGRRRGALIVWFWIGTHADYDKLLNQA